MYLRSGRIRSFEDRADIAASATNAVAACAAEESFGIVPSVRGHIGAALGLLALVSCSAAATAAVDSAKKPTGETPSRKATLDRSRLLRQGEFERFFVLARVYRYGSPEAWVHSPDAPVSATSAARLRQEGFRLALSERLRAWHGVGEIYPFKVGWYGTSVAVEFASPDAARAEVRAMIHDDQVADSPEQPGRYRPFAVAGIPGARGYCVGHDCRVVYTLGREVHMLNAGWKAGAKAMNAGPPLLDRMRIAAARQYARLRKIY
jgi:hypothetical protein